MTEAEWLACEEPIQLLDYLRRNGSERKARLFVLSCCRRIWHLITDQRCRQAVEVAERSADGMATEPERAVRYRAARQAVDDFVGSQHFEEAAIARAVLE